MDLGKTVSPKIEHHAVATKREDGWYVGDHGPFASIDAVHAAKDATAIVATREGAFRRTVLIDGDVCGDFNQVSADRTPNGLLVLSAWRPEDDIDPVRASHDHFLLYKNGVQGPFRWEPKSHDGFACSVMSATRKAPGGVGDHVFVDGAEIGPFRSMHVVNDGSGSTYLFCSSDMSDPTTLIGARGVLGTFASVDTYQGGALIALSSRDPRAPNPCWTVIYGGKVVMRHEEAKSVWAKASGARVFQGVCTIDKHRRERVSLYRDGLQFAGPYDHVTSFTALGEDRCTFIAYETPPHGAQRCVHMDCAFPR